MANFKSASSLLFRDPAAGSVTCVCVSCCESNETPGLRGTGDDTSEPPARGDDGPSERVTRNGVLHALRTDSGLPDTERRVGVELNDIVGKCVGLSVPGTGTEPGIRALLTLREDDSELESENCEPGLDDEPASLGSGLRRGETWTLPEKGE